jgi:hypothetical protein
MSLGIESQVISVSFPSYSPRSGSRREVLVVPATECEKALHDDIYQAHIKGKSIEVDLCDEEGTPCMLPR